MGRRCKIPFKRILLLQDGELATATRDALLETNGLAKDQLLPSLVKKAELELPSMNVKIENECLLFEQLELRMQKGTVPWRAREKAHFFFVQNRVSTVKDAFADGFVRGYGRTFDYAFGLGIELDISDIQLPDNCVNPTEVVMHHLAGPEIVDLVYPKYRFAFLNALQTSVITQSFITRAIQSNGNPQTRLLFKLNAEIRLHSGMVAHRFGFACGFGVALCEGFEMGRKFRNVRWPKPTSACVCKRAARLL